jgi:hypothetical protein
MSDIATRGDERAKKRSQDLSARRMLFLMQKAGVPEDMLDVGQGKVASMITERWDKCGEDGQSIANYISNFHKTWARNGTYVVIEGGDPMMDEARRDWMMHYCLFKAIVANFNDAVVEDEETTFLGEVTRSFMGEVTKTVDFLSNLPFLASFEKDRFSIMEQWANIPVLAIREIDPTRAPRASSDAATIIDSILRRRRIAKKPTILTFMGETSDVKSGFQKGGTSLGVEMANIARTSHNQALGVIRIRIEGQEHAEEKQ